MKSYIPDNNLLYSLFVCLSLCLSLSVSLSVCPSVCLSVFLTLFISPALSSCPRLSRFLMLLADLHQMKGNYEVATKLTHSISCLTPSPPSHLTPSHHSPSHLAPSPFPLISPNDVVRAKLADARRQAELHLDLQEPQLAQEVCRKAFSLAPSNSRREGAGRGGLLKGGREGSSYPRSKKSSEKGREKSGGRKETSLKEGKVVCVALVERYDLELSWLHLVAGRATMQEVECSWPALLEELWSNRHPPAAGRKHLCKQPRRKKAQGPAWLSLVPAPLSLALSHFSSALQLAHSASATLVQREAYRWLSLLLSPYHPLLSSHCLLLSSQLSLSLQAALALGKKIRKRVRPDSIHHPFQDVLITLHDTSQPCPKSYEGLNHLLAAHHLLLPPPSPPPLSFTLSLLSCLPEGSQFTTLSLTPSPSKGVVSTSNHTPSWQDHLIISTVGNGREPLLVKVPIKAGEVLAEFGDILHLSEQSLHLSEKRAWWTARRKLDSRMKVREG